MVQTGKSGSNMAYFLPSIPLNKRNALVSQSASVRSLVMPRPNRGRRSDVSGVSPRKKKSEKKVKKSIRKRKLVPPHLRWRKLWWVPIYCFLSYFAGDIRADSFDESINQSLYGKSCWRARPCPPATFSIQRLIDWFIKWICANVACEIWKKAIDRHSPKFPPPQMRRHQFPLADGFLDLFFTFFFTRRDSANIASAAAVRPRHD